MPGLIIHSFVCGRGGIGIRARLRGVSGNGYGFKSRRPHLHKPCRIILHGFFIQHLTEKTDPAAGSVL